VATALGTAQHRIRCVIAEPSAAKEMGTRSLSHLHLTMGECAIPCLAVLAQTQEPPPREMGSLRQAIVVAEGVEVGK
jgi:hypothetical protein